MQPFRRLMVAYRVVVRHLHWFQLFQPSLLLNFILPLISILLKVAHIGDITHVSHLIALRPQQAHQHIERNERPRMAEMRVTIHRWATYVKPHMRRIYWLKHLFPTTQRVVQLQLPHGLNLHLHCALTPVTRTKVALFSGTKIRAFPRWTWQVKRNCNATLHPYFLLNQ